MRPNYVAAIIGLIGGGAPSVLPVTSNLMIAAGLDLMVSGYSGPSVQVTRESDSATLDIGRVGSSFDTAAAIAFQGSSRLRVTKHYDQSGLGNNLTSDAATAPILWLGDGGPVIINGLGYGALGLLIPSTASVDRADCAILMATRHVCARNASMGGPWQFGDINAASAAFSLRSWGANTYYGPNPVIDGAYKTPSANNYKSVPVANMSVIGFNSRASGMSVYRDEQALEFASISSSVQSGGRIMRISTIAGGPFDYRQFVVYSHALSDSDMLSVRQWMRDSARAVSWSPTYYGHFQGDSRYKGDGVVNDRTVAAVLEEYYGRAMLVRNFGQDGDIISGKSSYWTSSEGRVAASGITESFVATRYAHNDVKANGLDIATLISNATAYYTNLRASGVVKYIVGCTEMPDKTLNSTRYTELQAFNAWMRSDPIDSNGARIFDAIVDNAWDPVIGDVATYVNGQGMFLAQYSGDGIHPSEYCIKNRDVPMHVAALQSIGIMPSTIVAVEAPVSASAPAITGTAQVGQVLSATSGSWSNTPSTAFTNLPCRYRYQWRRDGVDIAGATRSTYTPVDQDVGHALTCVVTASNYAGTAAAVSSATSAVISAAVALTLSASWVPTTATAGAAYSGGSLAASGGTAPYSYAVTSGALPSGLTLNATTGVISGTPVAAGSSAVTFTVTDSASATATASVTFEVASAGVPLSINGTPATTATVGASYSWTATAAGGVTPYTFSDVNGALPPGVTVNSSTGVVSGTPTASGDYNNVIIRVTDQLGTVAQLASFSITVSAASSNYMLDSLSTSAASAYSLRKLRSAYSGAAIRVRRSSDNTEMDIGFSGQNLDTASLLSFVGSGDGYISVWYDQSGNSLNQSQGTAANQNRIVVSGAIDTLTGKTAAVVNSSVTTGYTSAQSAAAATREWVFVGSHASATNGGIFGASAIGGQEIRFTSTHQVSLVKQGMSVVATSTGTGALNTAGVFGVNYNGATANFWINGSAAGSTSSSQTWSASTMSQWRGGSALAGRAQEFLVFDSLLSSSDRTSLYANQKAYWGTP